jgi:ComF family protein
MIGTKLLSALWPSQCASCDEPVARPGLCTVCMETLVPATDVSCSQCGSVFLDLPPNHIGYTCGPCLIRKPSYHQGRAAFAYGGALKHAIVRWKNTPHPELSSVMAELMASQADVLGWSHLPKCTVVVPVPTSLRRALKRGFNPAGQLAKELAIRLDLPCRADALIVKSTRQTSRGLSRTQRKKRTQRFIALPWISGKSILLVDDVRTTGATIDHAARTLTKIGVNRVDVALLADVPSGNSG